MCSKILSSNSFLDTFLPSSISLRFTFIPLSIGNITQISPGPFMPQNLPKRKTAILSFRLTLFIQTKIYMAINTSNSI